MNIKQYVANGTAFLRKISTKNWLIIGGSLLVVAYALVFFVPKPVTLSYAGSTCVKQFTLAPDLQRMQSDSFEATFADTLEVGGVPIASAGYCITPTATPEPGSHVVSVAPLGGWVARSHVTIEVPEPPLVNAPELQGEEVSATLPLMIELSSPDIIHTYTLAVGEERAECQGEGDGISCDIAPLSLKHGTEYEASLYRAYRDDSRVVESGTLETLEPLELEKTSIKNKQTIYSIPRSVTFTFKEEVESADITLIKKGESEPVATGVEIEKNTARLTFEPLAREQTYQVKLESAVGVSGRSLEKPQTTEFNLSGGPKVKNVSVGSAGVARSTTIIVTFDQAIDESVDITEFASASGVSANVSLRSPKEVAYTISGGDCAAFTLRINKGIPSGSNEEVLKDDWSFGSRTICGTSWSIGTSVQGRPIVAYSFGSGSTNLLFTAAIHGSEPSSYSTMMGLVQHLQMYGDVVPKDKRVVIVPNTNPDGIAMGTRYNANDVNLGRNFPTSNWSASIETASGTLPKGGGKSAGSEPETKALMSLTQQLRPRLEVSYHAQGSLVGANKYSDSTSIGATYAGTVGYATMFYNAEAVMGYPMTGEYEDWMGESMGLPAILIELPTHGGNYFTSQWPAIQKIFAL